MYVILRRTSWNLSSSLVHIFVLPRAMSQTSVINLNTSLRQLWCDCHMPVANCLSIARLIAHVIFQLPMLFRLENSAFLGQAICIII